jgi:hypothetical protein
MPISLTSANAALQIVSTLGKTLNAARERAQASKDTELKALVNTLYDDFAALKEAVQQVTDENAELRSKNKNTESAPKAEARTVGEAVYYFVGDQGPYCQPCYHNKGQLVMLSTARELFGGLARQCEVCGKTFFEKPRKRERTQVGGSGGPNSWLGG